MADKRDRLKATSIGKVMAETMRAQIVGEDGSMTIGGYTLTSRGLIAENASFDDWEQVGTVLFALEGSIQLLIGDWLVEAEREWGTTYKEIAEQTGYNPKSLHTYRWVCENVPFSMRMENLTISHYQVVAGLDDAARKADLLRQASKGGWSVKRLREALNPPALPEESPPEQLSLFDLLDKTTVKGWWLERRIERAGKGDENARLELLGKAAMLRRLADALEDVAGD